MDEILSFFGGEAVFFTALVITVLAIIAIAKTATVVPQQSAFIVESLGKYSKTLSAGFHILIPFIDKIAYKHGLKEQAFDIAEQVCITRDNVQVGIDGVLYMQVLDAKRASYGIPKRGNSLFVNAAQLSDDNVSKMFSKSCHK